MKTNPSQIGGLQFGELLASSWSKSATVQNGVSGFRANSIVLRWADVILDYAYISTDM